MGIHRTGAQRLLYGEDAMKLAKLSLLALALALAGAFVPQYTRAEEAKPFDFKPLVPPVFPVPPNSSITSGSVGGSTVPGSNTPPVSNTQTNTPPAPGMRLTITPR
jgi:hypothetical protein